MADTILTPSMIWNGFSFNSSGKETVLSERDENNLIIKNIIIPGRKTLKNDVKIFIKTFCKKSKKNLPALIVFNDAKNVHNENLARIFAEKGYFVCTVDYVGTNKSCTVYPEDISYAVFSEDTVNSVKVKDSAINTCFNEWAITGLYVVSYVKQLKEITSVNILGIKEGANICWQIAGVDNGINSAVVLFDAGWKAYKNIYKFGNFVVPDFSDEVLKYIAGISSESYASRVNCPLLLLSPTNSFDYDVDRSYDTLSRIPDKIYSAINYSIGNVNKLNGECFLDLELFFKKYSFDSEIVLPTAPVINFNEKQKDFTEIKYKVSKKGLKKICLFVSEDKINPTFRCWSLFAEKTEFNDKTKNSGFIYDNTDCIKNVFFFIKAEYENGFTVSSNIINKTFDYKDEDVKKDNIIFSDNLNSSTSVFVNTESEDESEVFSFGEKEIKKIKGPFDINGVFGINGLTTFKVNTKKNKPNEDAMLLLDVHAVNDGFVCVKMVSDEQTFIARGKVVGGNLWNNVKFSVTDFKTVDGKALKSYSEIDKIEISVDGEYLLNNVLWV